jgi:ATP-binding cassette subfamily B protein
MEKQAPPTPAPAGNPYRHLYDLTAGYRGRYALAVVLMGVAVAVGYVPQVLIAAAVDLVITAKPEQAPAWLLRVLSSMGVERARPITLWIPAVLIALSAALSTAFMYAKGRQVGLATEGLIRRLRNDLYDRLQHLPLTWHDRHPTGDLVQRCTSDVDTVRAFFSNQTVELARAGLLLVSAVPLMFLLDWRMALTAVSVLPVITAFSIYFFNKVKGSFKAMDDAEGFMSAVLQENLTGIRVVRAFHLQDFEITRFDQKNATHRDLHWKMFRDMSWFWSSSDTLCFTQLLVVLGYGMYSVVNDRISVGELLFFLTAVNMYLWPVREMGRVLTEMGKALVAVDRIHAILSEPVETHLLWQASSDVATNPSTQPTTKLDGSITLSHLSFSHGEKEILHDISLTIPPGQTLALLGPSGSGKTTLISLLLRFYDHSGGSIRLGTDTGEQELSSLPRDFVRSQFAVVMQEPFLFSKTVAENIRLGQHDASQDAVEEVARHAAVHSSIAGFAQQYQTIVGERGVTLSGGQRQRVAIARALLRDTPFLVLDDALSAVDTHTETLILDALKRRRENRNQTTLLIAHRLSTLMHADQIAVLEHGRLTQLGTHDQLVAREGLYQRLWQIQTALEEDLRAELENNQPTNTLALT